MNSNFRALLALTLASVCATQAVAESAYIRFKPYGGDWNKSPDQGVLATDGWLALPNFSYNVEQTLSIGSQSSGAGAGKITFNPFSFKIPLGQWDSEFFARCASGSAYQDVQVAFFKQAPSAKTDKPYVLFDFKLVAVKTIALDFSGDRPFQTYTFEYGGLWEQFTGPTGQPISKGWNRVRNVELSSLDEIIK